MYASQHVPEPLRDVGVRHPQDLKALASELLRSEAIGFDLEVMHRAIDLDHQLRGVAIEVDDESDEHMLATELEPSQTVSSQILPQDLFSRCLSLA